MSKSIPDSARNKWLELVEQIEEARRQYYLLDSPTISDDEYDKAFRELEKLEEKYVISLIDENDVEFQQIFTENVTMGFVDNVEESSYNQYGDKVLTRAESTKKVKLNKIMRGDVKKYKVYVKNDKGNVVKVNFGQKGVKIKKSNPDRRRSFRARHNCDNPGPRWKARYWSCRKW